MAAREEQIRVSIIRGQFDPEISTLSKYLRQGEANLRVNVTTSLRGGDHFNPASLNTQEAEEQLTAGVGRMSEAIARFNQTATLKVKVDTTALDALDRRLSDFEARLSRLNQQHPSIPSSAPSPAPSSPAPSQPPRQPRSPQSPNPLRDQREALRYQRIEDEFFRNSSLSEFGSFLTAGNRGRLAVRQRQAQELEVKRAIPALAQRLTDNLTADNISQRSPLISLRRLAQPSTALQVAAGAATAGPVGLLAAGIGGAIGGPAGAAAGLVASQVVSSVIDPVINAFKENEDKFKEAGAQYSQTILGISSVLQAGSRVTLNGRTLADNEDIGLQLRYQESRARAIQQESQKRLIPLGVGGATESTAVQGVVSALQARGISGTAQQYSKIAQLFIAPIAAQRRQLLDNPTLFLRDVQDYLGGINAKRTLVGKLGGLRQSLSGVESATNAEDLIKALQPNARFVSAVTESDNLAAIQQKREGAEQLLNQAGGEAYNDEIKPAIANLTKALQSQELLSATKTLGSAFGQAAAAAQNFATEALKLGARAVNGVRANIVDPFSFLYDQDQELNQQTFEQKFKPSALGDKANPTAAVDNILKAAGLEGLKDQYRIAQETSPLSTITALNQAQRRLRNPEIDADTVDSYLPAILSKRIDAMKALADKRAGVLGGLGGGAAEAVYSVRTDALDQQQGDVRQLISNLTGQSVKASGDKLDGILNQITEAQEKGLNIELQKLAASEAAAHAVEQSLSLVRASHDTTTYAGARSSAIEEQHQLGRLSKFDRASYDTVASGLKSAQEDQDQSQRGLSVMKNGIPVGVYSQYRQKVELTNAFKQRLSEEENKLNADELRAIRAKDQEVGANLIPQSEYMQAIDRGTLAGQTLYAQQNAGYFAQQQANAVKRYEDTSNLIEKQPNAPENRARREALDRYRTEYGAAAVGRAGAERESISSSFKLPMALNELEQVTVKLQSSMQEEANKRAALNNQIESSTAALREFQAQANAKFSGEENSIFSLAKQYKDAGGALNPALDLSDDQLKEISRNDLGAQLSARLAAVGKSNLSPTVSPYGVTGLVSPLANGSFQLGIQREQLGLRAQGDQLQQESVLSPLQSEASTLALMKQQSDLLGTLGPAVPSASLPTPPAYGGYAALPTPPNMNDPAFMKKFTADWANPDSQMNKQREAAAARSGSKNSYNEPHQSGPIVVTLDQTSVGVLAQGVKQGIS